MDTEHQEASLKDVCSVQSTKRMHKNASEEAEQTETKEYAQLSHVLEKLLDD